MKVGGGCEKMQNAWQIKEKNRFKKKKKRFKK